MERASSGVESIQPVSVGEAFVRKWIVIKDIQAFAMGTLESKDLFVGSPEMRERLDTEQGKEALTIWLKAFDQSFALANRFHIESQAGIPFNAADWQIMNDCLSRVLDVFVESLLKLEATTSTEDT